MLFKVFGKEILSFSENQTKELSLNQAVAYLESLNSTSVNKSTVYKEHVWVYACINRIARNISRLPFRLYSDSGFQREVTSGQVYQLFKTVNPFMNTSQLWEATQIFLEMRGNAFWHLVSGVYPVSMIEILNPDKMRPALDNDKNLIGWTYINEKGQQIPLLPSEIMHFKLYNPFDKIMGLSPLSAAFTSVEIDSLSRQFNKSILQNGSYPGGVLETDKQLNDVEFKRLRAQWEKRHNGVQKAAKVALLENGLKYKEVKITPEELKYIEQRKLDKEEIHAAFEVPTAITGATDAYNRSNMKDIKKAFWTETLIPHVIAMQNNLQTNLLDVHYKGTYCKFDLSVIPELAEDFNEMVDTADKLYKMGIPFKEINDRLSMGFDTSKYPWLETALLPFNLVPASEIVSNPINYNDDGKSKDINFNALKKFSLTKTVSKIDYTIWKSLIGKTQPLEKAFASKLSKWILDIRKETLNNFFDLHKSVKAGDVPIFNVSQNKESLKLIATPFLQKAIEDGGELAIAEVGIEGAFNLVNERSIAALNGRANKITGITDTIFEQVNDVLQSGVSEGLTTQNIADNIRGVFNNAQHRAKTIARTEINGAANNGKLLAYQDVGVEEKTWINSFDDNVRDTHRTSETVKIDDLFSMGLMFPGDQNGEPGEVINCRCTMKPSKFKE